MSYASVNLTNGCLKAIVVALCSCWVWNLTHHQSFTMCVAHPSLFCLIFVVYTLIFEKLYEKLKGSSPEGNGTHRASTTMVGNHPPIGLNHLFGCDRCGSGFVTRPLLRFHYRINPPCQVTALEERDLIGKPQSVASQKALSLSVIVQCPSAHLTPDPLSVSKNAKAAIVGLSNHHSQGDEKHQFRKHIKLEKIGSFPCSVTGCMRIFISQAELDNHEIIQHSSGEALDTSNHAVHVYPDGVHLAASRRRYETFQQPDIVESPPFQWPFSHLVPSALYPEFTRDRKERLEASDIDRLWDEAFPYLKHPGIARWYWLTSPAQRHESCIAAFRVDYSATSRDADLHAARRSKIMELLRQKLQVAQSMNRLLAGALKMDSLRLQPPPSWNLWHTIVASDHVWDCYGLLLGQLEDLELEEKSLATSVWFRDAPRLPYACRSLLSIAEIFWVACRRYPNIATDTPYLTRWNLNYALQQLRPYIAALMQHRHSFILASWPRKKDGDGDYPSWDGNHIIRTHVHCRSMGNSCIARRTKRGLPRKRSSKTFGKPATNIDSQAKEYAHHDFIHTTCQHTLLPNGAHPEGQQFLRFPSQSQKSRTSLQLSPNLLEHFLKIFGEKRVYWSHVGAD